MTTKTFGRTIVRIFFITLALFLPSAKLQAQLVTNNSGGWYLRGSGTNNNYLSIVIPLDFERGVPLPLMDYQITGSNYFPWNSTNGTLYHYNATNSSPQTNTTGRFPCNQTIVGFGSRAGGSPLYFNQPYEFGIFCGQPVDFVNQALRVLVYRLSDGALMATTNVSLPQPKANPSEWWPYMTNGYSKSFTIYGMTTTLTYDSPEQVWGTSLNEPYHVTHVATTNAAGYAFQVEMAGFTDKGATVLNNLPVAWYDRLYTVEFTARSPWRSVFIDQPQFSGKPMPPSYDGKSIDELLTNPPPVTNIVSLSNAPATYTNIDQSPELRRHPILDQFVSDMRNDPIALAAYVQNEIALVDAVAVNDDGSINDASVNLGGVGRSALTTYLSGQGSPAEQSSLLVYLLRQAGYPAVYMYPPRDQLQMLDTRLSKMLHCQLQGAVQDNGSVWTSNRLIAVNYPWVATYVSNRWVHLFPWIKDTEIAENLNLWDVMPSNYQNGFLWTADYFKGNPSLLSLASENTPDAIFPAFLKQTLLQNYPGVSVDDIGVQITDRRHDYVQWSDFPRPTYLTNYSYAIESFSDPNIVNVNPGLANIFDLVNVLVYSQATPSRSIATGDMRIVDLLNRKFILRFEKITSTTHRMILSLEPYRTNVTGIAQFTNDSTLLKQQIITNGSLTTADNNMIVQFTYKRHRALPAADTNTFGYYGAYEPLTTMVFQGTLGKGDLAALCISLGTSKKMLQVHAQEYWNMEQQLQGNASLSNSISPDVFQGTAAYLMGLEYCQKCDQFLKSQSQLEKACVMTEYSLGLSKLAAQRTAGVLPSGNIDLIEPQLDVLGTFGAYMGNNTLHPNSGEDWFTWDQNFPLLLAASASANEHAVIDSFFNQSDAISTVRLLQLAQSRAGGSVPGIYFLNHTNYLNYGSSNYFGVALKNADTNVWKGITNFFFTMPISNYVQYIVTPGVVTNATDSYKGMGAFSLALPGGFQALIGPNSLNGGSGENFPAGSFGAGNMVNLTLTQDSDGNFHFSYVNDVVTKTLPPDSPVIALIPTVANDGNNGDYVQTPFQNTYTSVESQINGSSGNYGNNLEAQDENGSQGQPSDHRTIGQYLADPVDVMTGEFYIDAVDLSLPGPMPMTVRRNYSSQNVIGNQFGIGWKLNYMPFLTINSGGTIIYSAEPDGSVIAYQSVSNNLWMPSVAANPTLNTHTAMGTGSTANLFNGKIVKTQNGGNTFYTLYAPDGSQRIFQVMSFTPLGGLTSTRPYLIQWVDNCGNSYTVQYGTDPAQPDCGQARRIQCSNGNYLGFYFDVYGHITDAYTGDGRRVEYDYDNFGDLSTVTLPDQSQVNYVYQHGTQAVTNSGVVSQVPYSTHLIIQEISPNGRELDNSYDSQRRVTNQVATVGVDLSLIRSGSFAYTNNFVLTNLSATITGSTGFTDAKGNPITYTYSNSLITAITDQLGETTHQYWYADNATAPGYPRSLWKVQDKRGLWTQYQYDAAGNITNTIVTGDLKGAGNTNDQAVTTAIYNSNNLPLFVTNAVTNVTRYIYDSTYPFLPQQIVHISGGTSVSADYMIYGSVTSKVTNGTLVVTNTAYGLLQRKIWASGSTNAATNDWVYDGRGYPAQQTKYSATTDPNVVINTLFDERGELVWQTDVAGRNTHFDYDPMGRLTTKEYYDENGNLIEWNYLYYNENGDLEWTDGPRFNPEDYTWRDYDGAGRKIQEIHWTSRAKSDGSGVEPQPDGSQFATSFFFYDTSGELTNKTDPLQNAVVMDYDALSRVVRKRSYDAGANLLNTEGYSYSPGDLIATTTNALGGVTTYTYTTDGKPEMRVNPDGSTDQWRYYLDGRIAQEITPSGGYWQYNYDDVDLKVTRTFVNGGFVSVPQEIRQYDLRGNLVSFSDADGNVFTSTFDGLNRAKITSGPATVAGTDQQTTIYDYDASGKVLTEIDGTGNETITTSDAAGRPVSVVVQDNSSHRVRFTTNTYSPDHNTITTTVGTTNPITTVTFSDTYRRPVIVQNFPTNGVTNLTVNNYDLDGNLLTNIQSSTGTGAATYGTTVSAYNGLNQLVAQTRNGVETTTFAYNAMGSLTNRLMPGSLKWQATFNNANQITYEQLVDKNNGVNRAFTYAYYTSGTNCGLLHTVSDPRSVTFTYSYDGFRRLANKTSSGSLAAQNMSTSYQYDNRSDVTLINETTTGQPSTEILRAFDGYGQITDEQVFINGLESREVAQQFDANGRRKELIGAPVYAQGQGAGRAISYTYRADGLISGINPGGLGYLYNYGDNGLMVSRSNPFRTETFSTRDGLGRITSASQTVNGTNQLVESLTWRADGKLKSYLGAEPGFNDSRTYTYNYNQVNRLTNETLPLLPGESSSTFGYTFDAGASGGPGVLSEHTMSGGSYDNDWALPADGSGLDALSRVVKEDENWIARRSSEGSASGAGWVTMALDGRESKNVDYDPVSGKWRAIVEMANNGGGYRFETVRAYHPTGIVTGSTTNRFAPETADYYDETYDAFGNMTMHRLRQSTGTYLITQTLNWDAAGRLVSVTNRDNNSDGFNWTAAYDGLGRRLRTIYTPIIGSVVRTNITLTLDSWYDPEVQYLEIAVAVNNQRSWKIYGPDISQGFAMQGTGGLEATIREYDGLSFGLINDYFGNAVATVSGTATAFGGRVNSYGPLASQPLPLLSAHLSVAQATVWRGKRIDPTGFYYMGARYYDPNSSRFLSPDPLGHNASIDLYSAFGGDAVNNFDPQGLCIENLLTANGEAETMRIQNTTSAGFQAGQQIAQNSETVYNNAIQTGDSQLQAYYQSGSYVVGTATGFTPAYQGWSGGDVVTGQPITGANRWIQAGTGTVGVIGTGFTGTGLLDSLLQSSIDSTFSEFNLNYPGGDNAGVLNGKFGPVYVKPLPNATPEQIAQTQQYVNGANQAAVAGALSPTGRVPTAGSLRNAASQAAAAERAAANAAGTPYQGVVGHVPDTTWGGTPDPFLWMDLDPAVNASIGGQANGYPIGYQPTEFIFGPPPSD